MRRGPCVPDGQSVLRTNSRSSTNSLTPH